VSDIEHHWFTHKIATVTAPDPKVREVPPIGDMAGSNGAFSFIFHRPPRFLLLAYAATETVEMKPWFKCFWAD